MCNLSVVMNTMHFTQRRRRRRLASTVRPRQEDDDQYYNLYLLHWLPACQRNNYSVHVRTP